MCALNAAILLRETEIKKEMKKTELPSYDQLPTKSQAIVRALAEKFGKAPDLFKLMGLSENALENYLNFKKCNSKGTFNAREIEAINLVISEVTSSKYCQSGHTVFGKIHGLSDGEILEIRMGRHSNPRLQAIISIAKEIVVMHGNVSEKILSNFQDQGFDTSALIDLNALVVDALLTNYICNMTQLEIDFPIARQVIKS